MSIAVHTRRPAALVRTALVASAAIALSVSTTGSDRPTSAAATRPTLAAAGATTVPTTAPVVDAGMDQVVAGLIQRMGADDPADRDLAQQQLVDLGDSAVARLRVAAARDADPEVRTRSGVALAEIRDKATNGATLLTLRLDHATPTDALAAIGQAAHGQLSGGLFGGFGNAGRPGPTVTLDCVRRPFWDVLADACGQLDVCPTLTEGAGHSTIRLLPTSRNWIRTSPHQVVGPFWVGVAGLYRLSSVDLSGPEVTDDQFLARLIVFPEPKLVVTQVSPLTVTEATDDNGNSLMPDPAVAAAPAGVRGWGRAMTPGRLPTRTVEARLRYPATRPGTRIATLAGQVTVTLAQGADRFEADDVVAHPTVIRPLVGVTVRVGVAARPGLSNSYIATVECVRAGLPDVQWAAMATRLSDLLLEDAAGRPLLASSWTIDAGNSDASFKATANFSRLTISSPFANRMAVAGVVGGPIAASPPGEPRRVVWNVAARFKVVNVPVAFHNLPMP